MPSITLLVPSRGRPHRFAKAVSSARELASEKIEVVSYFDDDDPSLSEYPEYHIVGRRVGTAKAILRMLEQVETPFALLGSDDIVFHTQGWDKKMLAYVPADGFGIVHAEDGWKRAVNHFLFPMAWHRLVGLFPDKFYHFGPDTWVCDVAKRTGRLFFAPDVMIEHCHYRNKKADCDTTYNERALGGTRCDNLLDEMEAQRKADAGKISAEIARLAC